jgi:hypothetical protein
MLKRIKNRKKVDIYQLLTFDMPIFNMWDYILKIVVIKITIIRFVPK